VAGEPASNEAYGADEKRDPTVGRLRAGDFRRTVQSEDVSRPGSIYEIETHREHIRLSLENWEKQWADVLRYERAKVQDDADLATIRRALTRAGASFALASSLVIPVVTDGAALAIAVIGPLTAREYLLIGAALSMSLCATSLWHAWQTALRRRMLKKARTRPLLPPERLDATQVLANIEELGNPPYYRERDVDPELGFGWHEGAPQASSFGPPPEQEPPRGQT
jgi:hypothetical protein